MTDFSTPAQFGDLQLKNRVVLAPLTRTRATEDRVPTDLMVEYYRQRANAGLILTEATVIAEKAVGYEKTPGLYNDAQVQAWKKIIPAVHEQASKIVVQLWHVGRISHPDLLGGETPVSASAIQPAGQVSLLRPKRDFVTPRALETAEVQAIVEEYRQSALLAKEAGFDGVEIHAANGYLIDQFLQTSTNQRQDQYGGSVENRARFLLEIVDAAIEVWGAGRVGVHLAPRGDSHDMGDADPRGTFGYVAEQLGQRKIAFIFTREYQAEDSISQLIKEKSGVPYIANENLNRESALALLASGQADAVAFGRPYIANPDLYTRLVENAAWNELEVSTMYAAGAEGYTDYPSLKG